MPDFLTSEDGDGLTFEPGGELWVTEGGVPVTTAIQEYDIEQAARAIFKEWLESYFDGANHDIGAKPAVPFPKVLIAFGQGSPVQPMAGSKVDGTDKEGSEIRVVMLPRAKMSMGKYAVADQSGTSVNLGVTNVVLSFQIRAKKQGIGQGEKLAERIGGLLSAILTNPTPRGRLARYGVKHLVPMDPVPIATADYAMKIINCSGQFHYDIEFVPPVAE